MKKINKKLSKPNIYSLPLVNINMVINILNIEGSGKIIY